MLDGATRGLSEPTITREFRVVIHRPADEAAGYRNVEDRPRMDTSSLPCRTV